MIRLLAVLLLLALPAGAIAAEFTPEERAALLRHGPWPLPLERDDSNRLSGNQAAIAFGQALFFDPRLSAKGDMSCATCHQPARRYSDNEKGRGEFLRNVPSLLDIRWNRWFGWDGAQDNLWSQSLRPMLSAAEMAATPKLIADHIRSDADLRCRYRAATGAVPEADDDAVAVMASKALAAFQETLISGPAPFDAFRDDLAANRTPNLSEAAQQGAKLFVGKGQCAICHIGPGFTNREFHDIGVPYMVRPGLVDPGRHLGLRRLSESKLTRLGPFSDDPARESVTTRHVTLLHRNWGEFRVPSLRNLVGTAPYMHNGSRATLRDVVRHYSELNEERLHADGERLLKPLFLGNDEIDALVAFLEALSGPSPAEPAPLAACIP
ncbi:cytochrome c peroxidase [Ferrovibrio sp. MS7]|uniref:cytochrome-c peroxidase n=1 Tax=Ferrovibrio plantarum TaxID=3119164 RepID=UPI00313518B8